MSGVAKPMEGQAPLPAAEAKPRKPKSSKLHPSDLVGLGAIGVKASRVRAALTMIGIAIGIAAMVGVLVISESSRSDLLSQLDRLGPVNVPSAVRREAQVVDVARVAPQGAQCLALLSKIPHFERRII